MTQTPRLGKAANQHSWSGASDARLHDISNRLASVVYPDGNRANYSYVNGRVAGITMTMGGSTANATTAVAYRPDGAMAAWTSGNGLVNTLGYDGDGRLASISVPGVQSLAFTYDGADRLTRIANGINAAWTQDFGYDALSRLTSVVSPAGDESYQYDANGSRVSQMVGGVTTPSVIEAGSNRLLAFGGTSYGYDANGNTTTINGTPRYHYNAFNRMDSVAGASFYVNPEGQRLRKTGSASTHYFAPDHGGGLLAEHDGVWRDYVWLNGRLVGVVLGGAVYPIHADQVGRPQAITNASSQAVVWASKNDAFDRNTTYNAWGNSFNIGFPGQYWDVESTLWHNGFRDYDARTGRYIQSDPIGLAGGTNTYAYVGGSPVMYYDPLGLWGWPAIPDSVVNGVGGFGDGVYGAITFGFGDLEDVREILGSGGVVDRESSEYGFCEVAGNVVGGVALGGATATRTIAQRTLSSPRIGHRLFTASRKNGAWNTGKFRFGWSGRVGSNQYDLMIRYKNWHSPPITRVPGL